MIDHVKRKLIREGKFNGDMMKAIYSIKNTPKPNHIELSDTQFKYACHAVHLDPEATYERIAGIIERFDVITMAEAQKVALIEELRERFDYTNGQLAVIIVDGRSLLRLADQGLELYHKRQQWRSEYPGTEAWLKQIAEEEEQGPLVHERGPPLAGMPNRGQSGLELITASLADK